MHEFSPSANRRHTARAGAAFGIGAYTLWGLLPLYLRELAGVHPLEVVSHRILWSLLLLVAAITLLRRWPTIGPVLRSRRTMLMLAVSAALIAVNWLIYIWAVFNGHVLAGSLGYFINPLVNVLLGLAVLHERLRKLQTIAVGIAAVGVAAMALNGGGAIWISLSLAISFSLYGLVRKLAAADPFTGLLVETALLLPFAAGWLLWHAGQGDTAFGQTFRTDLLLAAGGVITSAPLMMFAAAAERLRYATLGLFQYIAPTLIFIQAVLLFGEPVTSLHLFTFGCIWTGLLLYAFDSLRGGKEPPVAPPE